MSKLLSIVNKRGISCSNIPIIGFILCCVTFYPGFMSHDSVMQYTQSKILFFILSVCAPPLVVLPNDNFFGLADCNFEMNAKKVA